MCDNGVRALIRGSASPFMDATLPITAASLTRGGKGVDAGAQPRGAEDVPGHRRAARDQSHSGGRGAWCEGPARAARRGSRGAVR
eukprot:3321829-Rhodomonas_salina.4